jgi:hypothetical protein
VEACSMPLIKIAPVYKTINPMEVPVKKSITRTINADSGESALDLEEQIRCRAYELYERREREDGHEVEDWLQAEAEIAREKQSRSKSSRSNQIVYRRSQKPEKAKPNSLSKSRSSAQLKMEEAGNGH